MKKVNVINIVIFSAISLVIFNKLETESKPTNISSEGSEILSLKFDGKDQLFAIYENTIKIWPNINDTKITKVLTHNSVCCGDINSKSDKFVSGAKDGSLKNWDWANSKSIFDISAKRPIEQVIFLDSGDIFALMGNKTQIINGKNGQTVQSADLGPSSIVYLTISHKAELAAFCEDKDVKIVDAKNGKELQNISTNIECFKIKFSNNRELIAIADKDSKVEIWDMKENKRVNTIDKLKNLNLIDLEFINNNKQLVIGTENEVIIWDLENNKQLKSLKNKDKIYFFSVDNSEKKLATGDKGGFVKIFDINSGNVIKHFYAGKKVKVLAFNKAGNKLASGSEDGKIYLVDL